MLAIEKDCPVVRESGLRHASSEQTRQLIELLIDQSPIKLAFCTLLIDGGIGPSENWPT